VAYAAFVIQVRVWDACGGTESVQYSLEVGPSVLVAWYPCESIGPMGHSRGCRGVYQCGVLVPHATSDVCAGMHSKHMVW